MFVRTRRAEAAPRRSRPTDKRRTSTQKCSRGNARLDGCSLVKFNRARQRGSRLTASTLLNIANTPGGAEQILAIAEAAAKAALAPIVPHAIVRLISFAPQATPPHGRPSLMVKALDLPRILRIQAGAKRRRVPGLDEQCSGILD